MNYKIIKQEFWNSYLKLDISQLHQFRWFDDKAVKWMLEIMNAEKLNTLYLLLL